ncbi:MAG: aldehyde dehydrogenase family protein [Acidiferrobacterales bacterium]
MRPVMLATINPLNGEHVKSLDGSTASEVEAALTGSGDSAPAWAVTTFSCRAALMGRVAAVLRDRSERWAGSLRLRKWAK